MLTLITGFTCPPTIYFKFITKCVKCYYKVRQLFLLQSAMVCYYKVRQLFNYKVRQVLLQSGTGITKCDNFITKSDRYYKVRRLLQSATVHTLTSFFAIWIFFKDQRTKEGCDFEPESVSGFQKNPASHWRANTYSALSFDRRNFFNILQLHFDFTFNEK